MEDFRGKRVLVTGSARGIGLAAARLFLERGVTLLLHGPTAEALAPALAELTPAEGIAADLADRGECRRLAFEAGELDVLVNAAGIYEERPIEAVDSAYWQRTLAVNLTAPWILSASLLPGLRQRRGVIVNIASDAALLGYPGCSVYSASKGGLVGLTRALAVELAPAVRAICICPGPVDTEMMRASIARSADPAGARKQWADNTLLGRVADPREIAEGIVFAASPAASFATGSVWTLDGGVTAGKRS